MCQMPQKMLWFTRSYMKTELRCHAEKLYAKNMGAIAATLHLIGQYQGSSGIVATNSCFGSVKKHKTLMQKGLAVWC